MEDLIAETADPLDSPEDESDEALVRDRQRKLGIKRGFIGRFPFDVINLDLEEFIFQPKEDLPGKMVNALRKVFAWQRKPFPPKGQDAPIDEFSLIFTTQIGPPNITADCLTMLKSVSKETSPTTPG